MNLNQWLKQHPQLTEFDIAGIICGDLHSHDANLNDVFHPECFQNSFYKKQIVISLESWTASMLMLLHDYLRSKSADIENFTVIIIGHPNIAKWWRSYCRLMAWSSFNILEVIDFPFDGKPLVKISYQNWPSGFWNRHRWYDDFKSIDLTARDTLKYHFTYMAGTRPDCLDQGYGKQYLALRMIDFEPKANVSLSWPLAKPDNILNWVDRATYWKNQTQTNEVISLYNKAARRGLDSLPQKNIIGSSAKLYKKSFATVVRETVMDQPFGCYTEKTFRAFYFGQFVIPTTHLGVEDLERLGFWFDHELFDFDYQYERDFTRRIEALCTRLKTFVEQSSLDDLQWHQKRYHQQYQHNSDLAFKLTQLQSE